MRIEINIVEFNSAVQTALLRMTVSAAMKLNHASTYKRTWVKRLEEEVIGAVGEMAVTKAHGIYYSGSVNTFHRVPDCLGNIEVRSTAIPDGCLIVRDNDADDREYVLVIVSPPEVTIAGCILGSAAKIGAYLRNPHEYRPAWFVPQSELMPFLPGEK